MSTWSFVAVARWATVLGWGVVCPRLVLGQDASAAAQVLFEQGRDLLRNGQADEACPKLAESQRLDPAIGTLLALSICSEAQGAQWFAVTSPSYACIRRSTGNIRRRDTHHSSDVSGVTLSEAGFKVVGGTGAVLRRFWRGMGDTPFEASSVRAIVTRLRVYARLHGAVRVVQPVVTAVKRPQEYKCWFIFSETFDSFADILTCGDIRRAART